MSSVQLDERPPSLLEKRPIEPGTIVLGLLAVVTAHVVVPLLVLASQWLLVYLGLALARDTVAPVVPDNVIAAEFVRLGSRSIPPSCPRARCRPSPSVGPMAWWSPRFPREQPEKPEEKKEKTEARDLHARQPGRPHQGVCRGRRSTSRRAFQRPARGHCHLGQRGRHLPRSARFVLPARLDRAQYACQSPDKMKCLLRFSGRRRSARGGGAREVERRPCFDQSRDRCRRGPIELRAVLPEPPPISAALSTERSPSTTTARTCAASPAALPRSVRVLAVAPFDYVALRRT